MHISDRERAAWLARRLEDDEAPALDRERMLTRLMEAELFERFLHRRYVGSKRYSLEGAAGLIPLLDATHNWSYYFPMFRDFNESHCTTVLDFRYGEIEELGLDLYDFLNNVVNYRGGAPLRAVETDAVSDFENNSDFFYDLIDGLL
jgi:hypothetical protein